MVSTKVASASKVSETTEDLWAARHNPPSSIADMAWRLAGWFGQAFTPADAVSAIIPASAKICVAIAAAIGLRQVLPVHINIIFLGDMD